MKFYVQKLVVLMVACVAMTSFGAGFQNPPDGAAALASVQYRTTEATDPSILALNPANLVDLTKPTVTPTVTLGYQRKEYASVLGNEKSERPWRMLPAVFGSFPLREDIVIGVGINTPYSQGTRWPEGGLFKGVAPYRSEVRTIDLSPAIAVRFGNIQAGAGIDLIWSDLVFKQDIPWLPGEIGTPYSRLSMEGDGYGFGAHAGVTWLVSKTQRLAVAVRTPIDISYDGDFSMKNLPPVAFAPGFTPQSSFETEIHFPTIVSFGYSIRPVETLSFGVGAEWVEHSRNKELPLDIGNNNPLLSQVLGSTSLAQNWKDRWTFAIGAEWFYSDRVSLRCGWTYIPTPIPDETISPSTVEGDQHLVMIGTGYARGGHRLDLAYAYGIMEKRTLAHRSMPAVEDMWEFDSQLLTVSYSFSF